MIILDQNREPLGLDYDMYTNHRLLGEMMGQFVVLMRNLIAISFFRRR